MLTTNESVENYLETILVLSRELPVVRGVDISNETGYKKIKRERCYEESQGDELHIGQ